MMTPEARDAYFLGWLAATHPAIEDTARRVGYYGDAFGARDDDERFGHLKDAADLLRRAGRILSALEDLADPDTADSTRIRARAALGLAARER